MNQEQIRDDLSLEEIEDDAWGDPRPTPLG